VGGGRSAVIRTTSFYYIIIAVWELVLVSPGFTFPRYLPWGGFPLKECVAKTVLSGID